MALVLDAVGEILRKPTAGAVVSELLVLASPLWIAVLVGLLLGWAWRPRWAAGLVGGERGKPNGSGSALSLPGWDSWKPYLPSFISSLISDRSSAEGEAEIAVSSPEIGGKELQVTDKDLLHLSRLVEESDGGPAWHHMMDRTLPNMRYEAWRRDPETGPPQYRSRSVFEDAAPETVRDFFWDDEFRMKNKWDDMLIYHSTLEECPRTGAMLVHWIRKFPFFCSDREYTVARRIWKCGSAYYCVTKGVPCPSVPRRNKPRRVDVYYSSWCIRPVESRRGDGQLTACEVLLFHHEDMGIPWEIAKLGVRQGMWGCVKRIEPGLRAYQIARLSGEPLSPSAAMAQIYTKVSDEYLRSLETNSDDASDIIEEPTERPWGRNIPKIFVLGGAVVLACTLDQGLLTKAVIFGVARRFVNTRKRS